MAQDLRRTVKTSLYPSSLPCAPPTTGALRPCSQERPLRSRSHRLVTSAQLPALIPDGLHVRTHRCLISKTPLFIPSQPRGGAETHPIRRTASARSRRWPVQFRRPEGTIEGVVDGMRVFDLGTHTWLARIISPVR